MMYLIKHIQSGRHVIGFVHFHQFHIFVCAFFRYEEENFIRRVQSKKERNLAKRLRTVNELRDVTDFGDISVLTGEKDLVRI